MKPGILVASLVATLMLTFSQVALSQDGPQLDLSRFDTDVMEQVSQAGGPEGLSALIGIHGVTLATIDKAALQCGRDPMGYLCTEARVSIANLESGFAQVIQNNPPGSVPWLIASYSGGELAKAVREKGL